MPSMPTARFPEDRPVGAALQQALELAGFKVLVAADPGEALSIAQEPGQDIHLLVTDVVMPVMNGPEPAGKLKTLCPEMPVLYISGYTKDAIPDRDIRQCLVELLTKPFAIEQLCMKVREMLDSAAKKTK